MKYTKLLSDFPKYPVWLQTLELSEKSFCTLGKWFRKFIRGIQIASKMSLSKRCRKERDCKPECMAASAALECCGLCKACGCEQAGREPLVLGMGCGCVKQTGCKAALFHIHFKVQMVLFSINATKPRVLFYFSLSHGLENGHSKTTRSLSLGYNFI